MHKKNRITSVGLSVFVKPWTLIEDEYNRLDESSVQHCIEVYVFLNLLHLSFIF